jgi:hypothetical protein
MRAGKWGSVVMAASLLAASLLATSLLATGPVAAAETVGAHMDSARVFYQKGDIARAAHELEAALLDLQGRLGRGLAELMPVAPTGWQAEESEILGLGGVGGGLSVTRAYTKADASLNASIILDSPAVEAAAALMVSSVPPPNSRRVKVGTDDALLRWDGNARSGEITIVVGDRVLVQIEGDNLSGGDQLLELARGFNVPAIRKLIGI